MSHFSVLIFLCKTDHLTLIVAIINNAVQVKRSDSSTHKIAQIYGLVAMESHRLWRNCILQIFSECDGRELVGNFGM